MAAPLLFTAAAAAAAEAEAAAAAAAAAPTPCHTQQQQLMQPRYDVWYVAVEAGPATGGSALEHTAARLHQTRRLRTRTRAAAAAEQNKQPVSTLTRSFDNFMFCFASLACVRLGLIQKR